MLKIVMQEKIYSRTNSGKSWKSNPDTITTETVDREYYNNYVNSISWFNNFPGGSCRGYRSYTAAGYVISHVVTTGYGEKRVVDFYFGYDDMEV